MNKISKFILLLGILLLIFFGFLYFNIRIKRIIIISPEPEIIGLSVFNNKSYFSLNEKQITEFLLSKNIHIKKISISKLIPDKIILNVQWRKPVVKVLLGDKIFLIDSDGLPSKSYQNFNSNLPEIHISNISFNNNSADWRVLKALSLILNLDKYGFHFSSVKINTDSSYMTGLIDNSIEVFVSLEKDPNEVAASLQTIISRFRIEGKNISKIDYRFDKPVVVLKNE